MNHKRGKEQHADLRNKRQQILNAAYEVFSSKGYHRATVDEIIALADTGKGTVYNYFVNKEQLFFTLIKERSAVFEASLARIAEGSEQPRDKVETMIRIFLDFYLINADLWRVMMHEVRGLGSEGYSNFSPEQREKYKEWFCDTIGMLEKVLQEGIVKKVFRSCDTRKTAHALFSVIAMMVFQKFVENDVKDTAHAIADMFLYGIAQQ